VPLRLAQPPEDHTMVCWCRRFAAIPDAGDQRCRPVPLEAHAFEEQHRAIVLNQGL
jgi:hypothetical protein